MISTLRCSKFSCGRSFLLEKDNYENIGDEELEAMMLENTRITKMIEVYNDFWGIKSRLFNILNKRGKATNRGRSYQIEVDY
jgi:hypothetical protein